MKLRCAQGHEGPFFLIEIGLVPDEFGEPMSETWLQCRADAEDGDGYCDERFPMPPLVEFTKDLK